MAKTAKQALEALPATVRIGGYDFTLRIVPAEGPYDGLYGQFNPVEQVIFLDVALATPHRVVETLMHELCHGLCALSGVQDGDGEERFVTAMGSGLLALFRANPWLPKWLSTYSV